jgi:hypothetical protein
MHLPRRDAHINSAHIAPYLLSIQDTPRVTLTCAQSNIHIYTQWTHLTSSAQHSRQGSSYTHIYTCKHTYTHTVHTSRLLRSAFKAWIESTVESRMIGKSPMFSGLEYFEAADGTIADWFPVGRIRRTELDIRTDKLGSGTFAEV